jgi:hypothetical protein
MYAVRYALMVFAMTAALQTAVLAGGGDTTSIDLRGLAAFRPGDDDVWRSPYIDEREGWNFIRVPGCWERQGFASLDGFGWYRLRFRLPLSMRDDSLVLVMNGVDDADETFLNGILVGRSGGFPPHPRSELHSLRIYPLPRHIRQEFNSLAIRVYDMSDSGGVTGSMFRIVRVDSISRVLDEIVREPFRPPHMVISNGIMMSTFDPVTLTITSSRPNLYTEMEQGLYTEDVMTSLGISITRRDSVVQLSALPGGKVEYEQGRGIIHASFDGGLEAWWYHPHETQSRIMIAAVRRSAHGIYGEAGVTVDLPRHYWKPAQREDRTDSAITQYFIFAWNSCCDELAQRDLDSFLVRRDSGVPYAIDTERAWWDKSMSQIMIPPHLNARERGVYIESCRLLIDAQVNRQGAGIGQFVSSYTPPSQAYAVPRDHLNACIALARVGAVGEAEAGLDFIESAGNGSYVFYNAYGFEAGTGLPYLVTPARYNGAGNECTWKKKDDAVLSFDGSAIYIEAVEALRAAKRREAESLGQAFNDAAWLQPRMKLLTARAADVLLQLRDSSGLIGRDGGPWGDGLAASPDVYTTIHAIHALRLAAGYAKQTGDAARAYIYNQGADEMSSAIHRLVRRLRETESDSSLSRRDRIVFHPLLCDGITCGVFEHGTDTSATALDVVESGFSISDKPGMYNARPDGDWPARQARPFITLRLARAYAANGQSDKAKMLFEYITSLAADNNGMIPELVDPVSRNWYGGRPCVGQGAAEYVIASWEIR